VRENDNRLIHPLYLVGISTEASKYSPLKNELAGTIIDYEKKGSVKSVSVYFRSLQDASWMSINGQEKYTGNDLLMVPLMICYLKQEEEHPGSLNKELLYSHPGAGFREEKKSGKTMLPGKQYKISELLRYMIAESDDNAAELLRNNLNPSILTGLFTDLHIPVTINGPGYSFAPGQYSKFYSILFNSTFLNKHMSDYALQLLTKSKFSDDLEKNLRGGTTIAGKNSETTGKNVTELSATAIVYHEAKPYILTIMTRGSDVNAQNVVINEISGKVFKNQAGE
jgi:hypothetical protein